MPNPQTPAQLKEQLLAAGHTDFVVFSASGEPLEFTGTFNDRDKCDNAFAILQHCSAILKPSEKLKKITISFDDAEYVATVTMIANRPHGVVLKRPVAPTSSERPS